MSIGPGGQRCSLFFTAARPLLLAALLPLFPDETYYWGWSRRLASGYFDHPFGIALLIRAGTSLWSALGLDLSALAVRLGPCSRALSRRSPSSRPRAAWAVASGVRAALVVTCLPLAAAGLVLATPDAPLLAATAGTLYFVVRALNRRHAAQRRSGGGSPPGSRSVSPSAPSTRRSCCRSVC